MHPAVGFVFHRWDPIQFVLFDVALVVLAAQLFGRIFQRFGQPPVIGEVIAGIALGPSLLHGSEVGIPDLRAGATLVLAALAATGESRIVGTEHVARGYEDIIGKLGRVGARITEEPPS